MVRRANGNRKRPSWWLLLLLVPFIALLWPPFYAFRDPTLAGIPFFYWYQFLWVILGSTITGVVYYIDQRQ